MFKEEVTMDFDGVHYCLTLKGKDQIELLKRRNTLIRFIYGIPEDGIQLDAASLSVLARLERLRIMTSN